jgi:enoyl-CoA hydratase/carnithine racemase
MSPSLAELHAAAAARGIARYRTLPKDELARILGESPEAAPAVEPRRHEPVVRVERHGSLGLLTLDDPDTRNALGTEMLGSLAAAVASLAQDDAVRVVAITGAGRVFSSGAAIREHDAMPDGGTLLHDRGTAVLDGLAALPVPVVALLNGHAVGGGAELALAADWRLSAPEAEIRFVHAGVGLVPGFGGLARLSRLVGPARALHLLATRASVDGRRAVELGLALEVAPAGELVARARSLAEAVEGSDRAAIAAVKRLLAAAPHGDRAAERAAFLEAWPNRRIPDSARA